MRKLKLFFACLLMAVLSIGQVWGAVVSGTAYDLKGNSLPTNWTGTNTWSATSATSYFLLNYAANYVQTDEFCQNGFTSIVVSARKYGGPNATQLVITVEWVPTEGDPVVLGTLSPSKTSMADLTISSPASITGNTTGSIKVSCKGAGSGKGSGINKITVNYTAGNCGGTPPTQKTLESVVVSGNPDKTEYFAGQDFDPKGLIVTGHYSDNSDATITSGITWSYDPAQELAENQTSIKVKATVSEITSTEWYVVENLTVAEGPDVFIDLLEAGWNLPTSKVVAENSYTNGGITIKLAGSSGNGYRVYTNSNILLGKQDAYLELPAFASPIARIVVAGNSGGSGKVTWNIFKGDLAVSTAVTGCTNDAYTFDIDPLEANVVYRLKVTNDNNLQIKNLKIYFGEAPAVVKPSISGETPFLNSTNVSISIPEGTTVYYTTDGSNPKTAGTQYSAAFDLNNSATVKAIATDGVNWSEVAEKAFTKATIMTVAQARAAIDANPSGIANQYVAGTISKIDSYNSTYKSITYWISDDGTTTNQLQVYSGLAGVVKDHFESKDDLNVGDDVTVKGTLKLHNNSVYEFDYNNTIEAYKPIARLAWSAESYDASLEGTNTFPSLTNTNGVTVSYSSSDAAKASFADEKVYDITLNAVGSTTITASFAGNETYKANSASYTLNIASSLVTLTYNVDGGEAIDPVNVSALPNPLPTTTKAGKNFGGWFTDPEKEVAAVPGAAISENTTLYAKWLDPYTVAEAKTVIDANPSGIENQYVAGIISQIDSYNGTYHSITYWISADGTTTNQLQVYGGLIGNVATALEKEQFTAKTDLELGDEVVVTGTLKLHNSTTYEFDKNNTIYTFSRKASAGLVYAVAAVEKIVGDDAFINELTNPHSVAVTYGTSDDQVATVANDGTVTIVGAGSATITASFAGNDQYKAAEVSYTLTVSAAPAPLSPYATVYTSNVAFVGGGSSYENNSKVVINTVQYDAQKVGASSKTGSVIVTVPAKTHTLHFHVFTWKNASSTISVSGDLNNLSASSINVNGDDAGGASTPYTIESNPVDHYQYITFDPVETETEITFSSPTSGEKRFIMYGINQEGGVLPVLDHIVITGNATALEYETGDVFSPVGLGVDAYYTLDNQPVAEPTHLDVDENWSGWSFNPAILTESTTVTVTATYEGKQDTKDVAVTVTAPATPEILVNPASIDFGTVYQNAIVDAQGISVTLKAVAAATVTLDGEGFSIDKAALSELNSTIVVTPTTTAAGTFAATITISDNAGVAADVVINLSMKVEAVEDLSGTWIKATSVAAGDRIIIGATVSGVTKTMGAKNTNNRAAVASTYEDLVLTPEEGTKTFLVVDAGEGKFALQALNGNYLTSATSGTGNNLLEAADYDLDNAKWTITIENGSYSIVAAAGSKTDLRYNSSNDIFSCYSVGSQKPIDIYKKGTPDYGSYQRTVTSGRYGTICLPKAGKLVSENVVLFEISYKESTDAVIYLDEVDPQAMEAGMPYIFFSNNTQVQVEYTSSVESTAKNKNGLYGTLAHMDDMSSAGIYMISDNQLLHFTSTASWLDENRAYIQMNDISTTEPTSTPGAAPRRRVAMNVQNEQVATGVDALNATEAPVKMIINGQLFILRGEKMYNVNGQLVK